eukprot:TRINITY_DN15405_c0_g1_i1.p1 TRINITY_DN15405_c0_g1~~TRINITY_DN15405_c0_g1_i1.p1  ORF type:complete len:147 (-),score=27.19 TRINITY_DN15405_c0_g1_i1:313-753(-)
MVQEYTYVTTNDPFTHKRVQQRTFGSALDQVAQSRCTFSLRSRKHTDEGRVEEFRHLDRKNYDEFRQMRVPGTVPVQRWTQSFIWRDHVFELDTVLAPERLRGTLKLAVECLEPEQELEFPPFLKVQKEVTEDSNYYTWAWAEERS